MRAALLYGPGDLRLEELPAEEPGAGEVVLRLRSAMTCGTDVKTYRRGHPSVRSYPTRLGHEFAGEVRAVGPGVGGFAVGDEVFCANSAPCGACFQCERGRLSLCEDLLYLLGGFAEEIRVPARIVSANLHRLPAGLSMKLGPLAEPLACAAHGIDRAGIEPGDSVAIVGGGSLGLMLCALARRAGGRPIVLDPHQERLGLAMRFGALATIQAERGPADADRVRDLTEGRGAGQVFEAVGRPESWELAIAMARPGGTVNLFGGCPAGTDVRLPTVRAHYEEVLLQGTYHHTPRHVAEALSILAEGRLPWSDLCGPSVGLEQLEDALTGRLGGPRGRKYRVQMEPG
jgi:L-iditol 2-dehydrogenase